MDNVLVDFKSALPKIPQDVLEKYDGHLDDIPGIFGRMEPVSGAIEAFSILSNIFDTYILSTSPWENPSAWSDKLLWVKKHLGKYAYKRLIITHHKNLNIGHFLIDDRIKNGADKFTGEHILFGSNDFPDWETVIKYLSNKA